MLQDKINKLIPYISENLITYSLWEEGNYTPFINVWQMADSAREEEELIKKIGELFTKVPIHTRYTIEFEDSSKGSCIQILIYPKFKDTDKGYEYISEDWSIEEMFDILIYIFDNIK